MRALIQRVSEASVSVGGTIIGEIELGLLVLLGISGKDSEKEIEKMVSKIIQLRIFNDENKKMNLSVQDVGGSLLVVSQFTLYGDVRKGNRPSFTESANPTYAKVLYEKFLAYLRTRFSGKVESGEFGADMKVKLV
ncbi:MAG: D-aminoacyl-tRNA deacylase, partial [Bacteroidia bacterium]|nr:D-aminoacyl-tRNA deacylase [Bacteroidia bacterium]